MPTNTPIIIAKEKYCRTFPPKRYRVRTTNRVVNDVTTVLLRDSLILLFTIFDTSCLFKFFIFSLILSKITMVSLREYPTIVKNAAMIAKDISYPNIENIPKVIMTSWKIAAIAPIAYINSNLIEI